MLDKETKRPVSRTLKKKDSIEVKPEEKTINLEISNTELRPSVGKEIPMHELLKAQKKIDENNRKLGITKEPLSRPRSKQTLPLANK